MSTNAININIKEEEKHSCDENHCEKCRRGCFCDCDGPDCGYCKVMRVFPEANNKTAGWWDALFKLLSESR